MINELTDISYHARDRLRQFDLYYHSLSELPLLVFVHGGAWISEDKVSSLGPSAALISIPEYRQDTLI
jgi:acetyl esterase/lipase